MLSSDINQRLDREFFTRSTVVVAQELLGKVLKFYNYYGIIIETEAYVGQDDPACHAARGKTKRTSIMYGEAGYSYVYLIYGIYYCLNIVTENVNFPAAVLIRGLQLTDNKQLLNGPGKICRELGINKTHNSLDLINHPNFAVFNANISFEHMSTPRIGISKGKEKLWRFVVLNQHN